MYKLPRGTIVCKPTSDWGKINRPKPKPRPDEEFIKKGEFQV